METPEIHHHKTGHSKADLILGCLAVVMSMVSVFIAMRDGRTMERLVAANTWPNISYGTSNERDGTKFITLDLQNTGVGPARIETVELFYKGQPMASSLAFMKACCGKGVRTYSISDSRNVVVPARETVSIIGMAPDANDPGVWDTLNKERFNVRLRVCYCSVFDECWVEDSQAPRPERAPQCKPSQSVEYTQ
jgi:hypothetical protein